MNTLPVKKLLDEAFIQMESGSASPPNAEFFVRFSILFERGRAEVQKHHSLARESPKSVVVLPTVLLSLDRNAVEPLEVTLSQIWPKDEELDLSLKWDRDKCNPTKANVFASLINFETGEVIDSSLVSAFSDEEEFLVTFSLPSDLSSKWKDLTLVKMQEHSPCGLVFNVGGQSPKH